MSKHATNPAPTASASSETHEPRRRKLRSCTTCRRQKARCEFTSSLETCHRCDILNIPCVFEADAHANLLACTAMTNGRSNQSGPSPATEKSLPGNSPVDPNVERRLLVIEEALRQILEKSGLPSLEAISNSLNVIRQAYPRPSNEILTSQASTPSLPAAPQTVPTPHTPALPLPPFNHDDDGYSQRRYPTALDYGWISEDQGVELTVIFEMRYNHCVYAPILKSQSMTRTRPFAFTVMSALAFRLKTTIPNQGEIREKTLRLIQSHLATAMNARPYTIDAIHGLLLLSLWSSALTQTTGGGRPAFIPDGWLLLSTAIQMAQTLHLDLAAAEVQTLHSRGKEGTGEYEVAMEKAKVWFALVTYDLAMSMASTRPRLITTIDQGDNQVVIDSFRSSPTDRCLAFHFELVRVVHNLHRIEPPTDPRLARLYIKKVDALIQTLDIVATRAQDIDLALSATSFACLEYRIFRLYHRYTVCVCFIRAASKLVPLLQRPEMQSDCDEPMLDAEEDVPDITNQILLWITQACEVAEANISDTFPDSQNDSNFLSTAPDHLFTAIAFCATALIKGQVTALQYKPSGLYRANEYDDAVARASDRLARLALPDSDLPRRYSRELAALLQRWKKRKEEEVMREYTGYSPQSASNGYHSGPDGVAHSDVSLGSIEDGWNIPSIHDNIIFFDPGRWGVSISTPSPSGSQSQGSIVGA